MPPRFAVRLIALSALALAALMSFAAEQSTPAGPAADDGEPAMLETATFAGGCFWCMEGPFDVLDGVVSTTSGYIGGTLSNPTYEQVSAGSTGHAESVQVTYDPQRVSYEKLLDVFWRNIDPTVVDQQFCDHGNQYRTAIFYHNDTQKQAAEASLAALEQNKPFKAPIKTALVKAGMFYAAEDYHQDYYKKNPVRYKFYRYNCGRDQRLTELWGAAGH